MSDSHLAEYKYIFVVTGYNCGRWVNKCIQSIIKQQLTNWHCVLGDDASTDNTFEIMSKQKDDPRFTVFRNPQNLGACYMRWKGIQLLEEKGIIQDQDVILLIGADDWLSGPMALNILEGYYSKGAEVSYGNWKSFPSGRRNKLKYFPATVLENRSYRKYRWTSTAVNGFRYRLFKQLDPEIDFKDSSTGLWINNCTDLAVMFPIMELADPKKISPIPNVIYVYNENHSGNTLQRFGTKHKTRLNKYIRGLPTYQERKQIL